jgi:NAD(P)-dependent dehydrogenase (short-subunit alcohol dehydrogenase family)
MILIAGGTGTLGSQVVRLLTARGLEVRIMTRNPARARPLEGDLVEIVSGDARNLRAVERPGLLPSSRRSTGLVGPGITTPGQWTGRGTAT